MTTQKKVIKAVDETTELTTVAEFQATDIPELLSLMLDALVEMRFYLKKIACAQCKNTCSSMCWNPKES